MSRKKKKSKNQGAIRDFDAEQILEKSDQRQELGDSNSVDEESATVQTRNWYRRDKNAKRPYVDEMQQMYLLYKGDHWSIMGPDGEVLRTATEQQGKPNAVENIIFAMVMGNAAEFVKDIELIDVPTVQDLPTADQDASAMTDIKKAIITKNKIENNRFKAYIWFFLYGTIISHPHWDPDWVGGRGPNRWNGEIRLPYIHPLMFIPDARVSSSNCSSTDVNDGMRCHVVAWHPLDWYKEHYPDSWHLIEPQIIAEDDRLDNFWEDDQGFGYGDSRADMCPLIETWYRGSPLILDDDEKDEGDGLHVIWWAGEDQGIYLRHANYIYYDPGEDSELKFPFVVRQCNPRENSIWGYGDAWFIANPQIIRNKTVELILESHLHNALGQTFYDPTALTPKQLKDVQEKGNLPGMYFPARNPDKIVRLYGQPAAASLQKETDRLDKTMQEIIGNYQVQSSGDSKNGKQHPTFAGMAQQLQQAQIRLRFKEQSLTQIEEESAEYINHLISKFYTERRPYRIQDAQAPGGYRYGMFDLFKILRVWDPTTNIVIPFPIMMQQQPGVEPQQLIQTLTDQGKEVYFPEYSVQSKVSSVMPADRMFNMQMAQELYQGKMIDAQAFFFVMEHGRFEPWDAILQRYKQQQQQAQQAQAQQVQQQGGGQPGGQGGQHPATAVMHEAINRLPAAARAKLKALPPGQQQQLLRSVIPGQGGGAVAAGQGQVQQGQVG